MSLTFRLFMRNWESFSFFILLFAVVCSSVWFGKALFAVELEVVPLVRCGDRERSFGGWASISKKEKGKKRWSLTLYYLQWDISRKADEEREEAEKKEESSLSLYSLFLFLFSYSVIIYENTKWWMNRLTMFFSSSSSSSSISILSSLVAINLLMLEYRFRLVYSFPAISTDLPFWTQSLLHQFLQNEF